MSSRLNVGNSGRYDAEARPAVSEMASTSSGSRLEPRLSPSQVTSRRSSSRRSSGTDRKDEESTEGEETLAEERDSDSDEEGDGDASNPYKAFDEIRRLAHYSLATLRDAIVRYEKFVNPRLSPALYAIDEDEFRLVFKLKPSYAPKRNKRHDKIVNDVYSRFAREDGRVDLLELFGGLAVLCDAAQGDESVFVCTFLRAHFAVNTPRCTCSTFRSLRDRLTFLFNMFDFGQNGEIVEDEFTLLMWAVASAFSRLGLIAMPSEDDLEFFAGSLYTTRKGQTFEAIDREQLLEWVEESEFARFLLEQVRLVPKLEGIIGTLKTHVGTLRADYRSRSKGAKATGTTENEESQAETKAAVSSCITAWCCVGENFVLTPWLLKETIRNGRNHGTRRVCQRTRGGNRARGKGRRKGKCETQRRRKEIYGSRTTRRR